MQFDADLLHDALDTATSWSEPSTFAGTKVHDGYRRIVLVNAGQFTPAAEPFRFVLEPFAPVWTAWLSWIEPGGFIAPHRDAGPWMERWQVPIRAAGWFEQDGERFVPEDGVAFPVSQWARHSVGNPTGRPLVHLVLDRDVPLGLDPQPFHVFEE